MYTLDYYMKNYLSLIKFSHTIFALPFALVGYVLGIYQQGFAFEWRTLILVLLCMVFARSAAMAFNRWQDRDIDGKNPRTAVREIPAGTLSAQSVLLFVIANCVLFVTCTYFINDICFYLSPIALLVVLGYSYTKRFTSLCHLVLGVGLALAPIGAYLAVTGTFDLVPVLYGVVVLFLVAGFDIIYSLQDEDFDRGLELNSIPVLVGKKKALWISILFHLVTTTAMLFAAYSVANMYGDHVNLLHWIGVGIFVSLLVYQHTLVKADDLSKVNLAFFTTNGIASIIFGCLFMIDMIW